MAIMKRLFLVSAFAFSLLGLDDARSADAFYNNFSDAIRSIYGSNWSVFIPFTSLPAAADDPSRMGETYPSHLWNFTPTTTAHGGTIYEQANVYCPPSQTPKPLIVGAPPFNNFQNLTSLSLTGDITIGPVKITAINAQYLKSITVGISSVQRMYLPGFNVLKDAVKGAVSACGSSYFYAINSVLIGKITISVAFNASIDAGVAATISSSVAFNLGAHAQVVQSGTADKPLVIQTDDAEIFAVQAVPVTSLQ
jgi:hypothetical protein